MQCKSTAARHRAAGPDDVYLRWVERGRWADVVTSGVVLAGECGVCISGGPHNLISYRGKEEASSLFPTHTSELQFYLRTS